MIANIKAVAVYVSDQKESLRFYTEKLGFEVRRTESMAPTVLGLKSLPVARCRASSSIRAP